VETPGHPLAFIHDLCETSLLPSSDGFGRSPTALSTVGHAGGVVNEDVGGPAWERRRPGAGMTVRHAGLDELDDVIRLAGLMYEAMGIDASGEAWRQLVADHLRRRLGDDVMVAVVDDPTRSGRLAATGAGVIAVRLPGPGNPSGRVGYIQWVSTDFTWRRRGLARAITVALLDWFTKRQVRFVELHTSRRQKPLYRAVSFNQGRNPGLRIQLAPTP
jgi:GNAT superfamily N-acetyltransferase